MKLKTLNSNLIKLINQFVRDIAKFEETIENTERRIIAYPLAQNPCETFILNDMFLNLYDVFEFYNTKCTADDFIEWYWFDIDNKTNEKPTMNLRHYLQNKKEKLPIN